MPRIELPQAGGGLQLFELSQPSPFALANNAPFPRIAYAAAHVVADPARVGAVDWDATLAYRHHLWGLGFKVAEAMDTSQRCMGLDWAGAAELISRSLREARAVPGADLACGVGTDQLDPAQATSLDDVIRAYEQQLAHVERHGGRAILMASRSLARMARGPEDYARVYDHLLSQARERLHFILPGERSYIVTDATAPTAIQPVTAVAKNLPVGLPWYNRLISSITETGVK